MGYFKWAIPATVIPTVAIFLVLAFGYTDSPHIHAAATFGSFLAAGLLYTGLGYYHRVIKALSGESVSFDWEKVGKTLTLGAILGFVAFGYTYYSSDATTVARVDVTDITTFISSIAIHTTTIVIVHKMLPKAKKEVPDDVEVPHELPNDSPPPARKEVPA